MFQEHWSRGRKKMYNYSGKSISKMKKKKLSLFYFWNTGHNENTTTFHLNAFVISLYLMKNAPWSTHSYYARLPTCETRKFKSQSNSLFFFSFSDPVSCTHCDIWICAMCSGITWYLSCKYNAYLHVHTNNKSILISTALGHIHDTIWRYFVCSTYCKST